MKPLIQRLLSPARRRRSVTRKDKPRDVREEIEKGVLVYPSEIEEFWTGKVFWV